MNGPLLSVKYQMIQKELNAVEESVIVKPCELVSEVTVKCPRPGFSNAGSVEIFFSINGIDFLSTNSFLKIISVTPSFTQISPNVIVDRKYTNIYIIGSDFINSTDILIKFYDNYVTQYSNAVYINDTHLFTNLVSFQTFNMTYPRTLKISLTFDRGITEKNSNLLVDIVEHGTKLFIKIKKRSPFQLTK
jgi:hypothetical protein